MISVVIPVLNEGGRLDGLLRGLCAGGDEAEIIVADGGSADGTRRIVEAHAGVRWVSSASGRARQLRSGAEAAKGDVLLFLHADTRLAAGWAEAVRAAAGQPGFGIGAFRFAIDRAGAAYRLIEWGVRLRCRLLRLPYGDQALFVRADAYREAGGFRELPIMEDAELVLRMRRRGRLALLPMAATTSARRWESMGVLRLTRLHVTTLLLYRLGVSPERLARRYSTASRTVVVFCKYPEPGRVKTRLAESVGDAQAVRIYRRMVRHTLGCTRRAHRGARPLVCFTPAEDRNRFRRWLGRRYAYQPQADGDLGRRMLEAFRFTAAQGIRHTLIVGTDCPGLRPGHLREAFERLEDHDLVLGPTVDGGYYLIGAARPEPALFADMPWSTDRVLPETLARAKRASLRVALLPRLRDVDTIDDLCHDTEMLGMHHPAPP